MTSFATCLYTECGFGHQDHSMPASLLRSSAFTHRLPALCAELEAAPFLFLDRDAVETWLGISRRSAIRVQGEILRRIGERPRRGAPTLVPREALLEYLRAMERNSARERDRIAALQALLLARQRTAAARQQPVPPPAHAWNPALRLDAFGRLSIAFGTTPDLLAAVRDLLVAAAEDPDAFERFLHPPESTA